MIGRTGPPGLRRFLALAIGFAALFAQSATGPASAATTWTRNLYDWRAFVYQDPYATACTAASTMIMLNVIAYRAYGDEKRDVVVDAAGYRARRQATLESLAERVADRVLESGEPEELEPMTAVERKVVHLRLKEIAGVGTTSEGTEPNRYVVVVPE